MTFHVAVYWYNMYNRKLSWNLSSDNVCSPHSDLLLQDRDDWPNFVQSIKARIVQDRYKNVWITKMEIPFHLFEPVLVKIVVIPGI